MQGSPVHSKEEAPTVTVGCVGQVAMFPERSTASILNEMVDPRTSLVDTGGLPRDDAMQFSA